MSKYMLNHQVIFGCTVLILLYLSNNCAAQLAKASGIINTDGRHNYWEVNDNVKGIADQVCLITNRSNIIINGQELRIKLLAPTLAHAMANWGTQNGCGSCTQDQDPAVNSYYDEPVVAECGSGVLVGTDRVLTAGHVIRDIAGVTEQTCNNCQTCESDLTNLCIIFGYVKSEPNTTWKYTQDNNYLIIDYIPQNVYFSSKLIYCYLHLNKDTNLGDFAVIRLERQITDHYPLKIVRSAVDYSYSTGTTALFSHADGLPLKIDYPNSFWGTSTSMESATVKFPDAFLGSSGGPYMVTVKAPWDANQTIYVVAATHYDGINDYLCREGCTAIRVDDKNQTIAHKTTDTRLQYGVPQLPWEKAGYQGTPVAPYGAPLEYWKTDAAQGEGQIPPKDYLDLHFCHKEYHSWNPSFWHVIFKTTSKARSEYDEMRFDKVRMIFPGNFIDMKGFTCTGHKCPGTTMGMQNCSNGSMLTETIEFEYIGTGDNFSSIYYDYDIPADYGYFPICYFNELPCGCCCSKSEYIGFQMYFTMRKGTVTSQKMQQFQLQEMDKTSISMQMMHRTSVGQIMPSLRVQNR